jgi:hypothetical protein
MENVITRDSAIIADMMSKIRSMENEVEIMMNGNLSCADKWMTGEEVMQKLQISKRTLQNYRDNGTLPYSMVVGKIYYCRKDIEDLMRKNYVQGK